MKEGPEVPAFKSRLETSRHPIKSGGYEFLDRKDVVVRDLRWVHMLEKGRFRPSLSSEQKSISAEEFATITKEHYDELASYGVRIPVSFVVAEAKTGDGQPREEVYAIVDEITKNPNVDLKEVGREFASLRSSLVRYYQHKFETNESFIADLFSDSQFVYGRKPGDTEDHVYLVDIEPYVYAGPRALYSILIDLRRTIREERSYFSIPDYDDVLARVDLLYDRVEQVIPEKHD